jgi:NAD(P)-dependent dehydrogenase (short-subunit alcohol dehydrogenase family)
MLFLLALVTGASKGIGRDIALALAKGKARVVIIGRDENDLLSLKTEIVKYNANANWGPDHWCTTIVADLADAEQARRAAETALATGPVDLLVNNAGTLFFPETTYNLSIDFISSNNFKRCL